jgi:serine/threonine protein kinase
VNTSGEVKLLDFGIVLFQGTDREASTETGTVLGSSQYMAPEQLLSSRCTSKADIFALGAILYEACARKRLLTKQIRLLMLQGAGNPLSFRIYVKRQLVHIPDITGLHELLVEMLEMDESIRPTASEVGLRCREIAKSLEGEGLREWCQTRRWSQPEPIPNPWLGLELSEKGVVDVRVKRKTKLLERPAVASTLPEVEQKLVVARKSIIQLITLIVLGLSVFGFWIFFVYK